MKMDSSPSYRLSIRIYTYILQIYPVKIITVKVPEEIYVKMKIHKEIKLEKGN